MAIGLQQAVTMVAAVRVPDDIALVDYDDIDFGGAVIVPVGLVCDSVRACASNPL